LDDLTATITEGRPHDIRTAFDKQRHYNWDIFLTTTNIGKIKSDIRQSSEWAYRHRSLNEISRFFKGQWYEHQHDTENNGKSESHRLGKPKRYKADKRVFNCYRSTATGEHIASTAGTTLADDGGIKFKFGIVVVAIAIFCYSLYARTQQQPPKSVDAGVLQNTVTNGSTDSEALNHALGAVAPVQVAPVPVSSLSTTWHISAVMRNKKKGTVSVYAVNIHGHYRRIHPKYCQFDEY
jgi:zona occludens toxin (predicted ATPase)